MSKYKNRSKTLTQIYNLPKILIWQASKYKAHKNPPKVHPPLFLMLHKRSDGQASFCFSSYPKSMQLQTPTK